MSDAKKVAKSEFRLDIVRLADVEEKNISWLWEPYLPYGKITILEGDPEAGKTFLSLDIAAHVTTGRSLPSFGRGTGESKVPQNVLFLTAEDDLGDTILPRFRKASGDPERFYSINGIIQRDDDREVHLGITLSHIGALEDAMNKLNPGLLIVDPFQAFVGARVDFHRANEVRPVMEGIGKLMARHDCAAVLIRHFAKAAYNNSMYKGIGSIDILAAARSVLQAGVNPQLPDIEEMLRIDPTDGAVAAAPEQSRFVFVHAKCNVAMKGPAVAYSICDGKLSLNGPTLLTADELKAGHVKRSPRKGATEFLMEQLATGKKPATELLASARNEGLSESTLRRAAKQLPIKMGPSGFGLSWDWEWVSAGNRSTNPGSGEPACREEADSGSPPEPPSCQGASESISRIL